MKKFLLTIAVAMLVTSAWAQSQLTTVRGKTKEGKTIKVEYYKGSVEDYVESVKYQLVDELQARVNDLQDKLDAANKQIKDLKSGSGGSNSNEVKRLNAEIEELNKALDNLQNQLVNSELSNDSLIAVNKSLSEQAGTKVINTTIYNDNELKRTKDSIAARNNTIRKLNHTIEKYEKQVNDLEKELQIASSKPTGYSRPAPVIGVALGMGPVFMSDELPEGWSRNIHWAKKAEVYFGTARMSRSVPFSIEAGVGLRNYKLSAVGAPGVQTVDATDADGDTYQAIYTYSNRTESLAMTYLDIPVRACFGQPVKNHVSVYAKVGVTPSVKVSSSFTGTGTYELKGYYPQWDVTLENITELGFGSDKECYAAVEPEMKLFVLWGNLAVGAYVPFKNSPLLLNAGLGLDIPFMGAGTAAEGMNLLSKGGKAIIPSMEVGLVITL